MAFIGGGLELEGSLKCFPSKRLRFKPLVSLSFKNYRVDFFPKQIR